MSIGLNTLSSNWPQAPAMLTPELLPITCWWQQLSQLDHSSMWLASHHMTTQLHLPGLPPS
jgi:hypothetical protein